VPAVPPSITSGLSVTTAKDAAFTYTITRMARAVYVRCSRTAGRFDIVGCRYQRRAECGGGLHDYAHATNAGGSDSKLLKLVVVASGTNHAPTFASPPAASAILHDWRAGNVFSSGSGQRRGCAGLHVELWRRDFRLGGHSLQDLHRPGVYM